MTEKIGHGSLPASTYSCGEPRIRRCHSGADIGDVNKMRRRRRRSSSDIQRELLREERELLKQKGALKEDLARLAGKVHKLKKILARRVSSGCHGGASQRDGTATVRNAEDSTGTGRSPGDPWDDTLDSLAHFLLVSSATLVALWLAVNLIRGAAVYMLPELFLECAVVPAPLTPEGTVGEGAAGEGVFFEWRSRNTLAWQLLFGPYPCCPVYLNSLCDQLKTA